MKNSIIAPRISNRSRLIHNRNKESDRLLKRKNSPVFITRPKYTYRKETCK